MFGVAIKNRFGVETTTLIPATTREEAEAWIDARRALYPNARLVENYTPETTRPRAVEAVTGIPLDEYGEY